MQPLPTLFICNNDCSIKTSTVITGICTTYFNPLPSLTLQSTRDLNVLCRHKRSKALLLSYTFKCPLKKRSHSAHAVGLLHRSGNGLTLSSPVMPCDIIFLILSFICYNFWGWKRLTLSIPKNATICLGWKGLTLSSFSAPQNFSIWRTELNVRCQMASWDWKGLRMKSQHFAHLRVCVFFLWLLQ
jgi:hypothetical protein